MFIGWISVSSGAKWGSGYTHLLFCFVLRSTLQQWHAKQKCAYRCRIVCELLGDCLRYRWTEIGTRPNCCCNTNPYIHCRPHYQRAIHTEPILYEFDFIWLCGCGFLGTTTTHTHLRHFFQSYVSNVFFSTSVCSMRLPVGHNKPYEIMPRMILYLLVTCTRRWYMFLCRVRLVGLAAVDNSNLCTAAMCQTNYVDDDDVHYATQPND